MTPEGWKSIYRRRIGVGKTVYIRRYTGAGINRPRFDIAVRARVTGYQPDELIGSIVQGDRRVIFMAEDVFVGGLSLPITTSDKLVDDGKELAIIAPDQSTREFQGVIIAFDLTVRG